MDQWFCSQPGGKSKSGFNSFLSRFLFYDDGNDMYRSLSFAVLPESSCEAVHS